MAYLFVARSGLSWRKAVGTRLLSAGVKKEGIVKKEDGVVEHVAPSELVR